MLKSRILTAVVCLPLVIVWLWFSNAYFIAVGVAVFSVLGVFELYRAAGLWSGKKEICAVGLIAAAIMPFNFMLPHSLCQSLCVLIVLALFFLMFRRHKDITLPDISITVFGVIYVAYLLSFMVSIRLLDRGGVYVWLVPTAAFSSDTFAYIAGRLFGKRKMCPEISPKKTVAGAVGGVLGCVAALMVFAYVGHFSIPRFALMGAVTAVVCEFGDLFASIIKRQYGVKDYGKVLPGHGGVLDRLDSIIVAAPVIYLILTTFR